MNPQIDATDKAWPAPAKLNLFLHITGRGADGYHDLQTLFQILDWGDELYFQVNDDGVIGRSNDVEGVPQARDICIQAAQLLKTHCGVNKGVQIELIKRTPMGAGLGGGSSDAATVLVALNHLWSCGMTQQQLARLGLALGADVPVFVNGHSALAQGRGEKLQAVSLGERYYVLVFPSLSISTAEVFGQPMLKRDSKRVELTTESLQPGRNDCENTVLQMYPELNKVIRDMSVWGQPHMSGTGSTFFLAFAKKKNAKKAASELECRYNVRLVSGVDRSGLLNRLAEAC